MIEIWWCLPYMMFFFIPSVTPRMHDNVYTTYCPPRPLQHSNVICRTMMGRGDHKQPLLTDTLLGLNHGVVILGKYCSIPRTILVLTTLHGNLVCHWLSPYQIGSLYTYGAGGCRVGPRVCKHHRIFCSYGYTRNFWSPLSMLSRFLSKTIKIICFLALSLYRIPMHLPVQPARRPGLLPSSLASLRTSPARPLPMISQTGPGRMVTLAHLPSILRTNSSRKTLSQANKQRKKSLICIKQNGTYVWFHALKCSNWSHMNTPNLQTPKCTCPIPHNTPEMCTFLFWMVHSGIWDRRVLEFLCLVYWLTGTYIPNLWVALVLIFPEKREDSRTSIK